MESEPAPPDDSAPPESTSDEPVPAVPTRETTPVWAQSSPAAPAPKKGEPDWSKTETSANGEKAAPAWAQTVPAQPGDEVGSEGGPVAASTPPSSAEGSTPPATEVPARMLTDPPKAVAADAMKSTWPPASASSPAPPEETDIWPPEPPTEPAMRAWPPPSELEEPATPPQVIPSWPDSFDAAPPTTAAPAAKASAPPTPADSTPPTITPATSPAAVEKEATEPPAMTPVSDEPAPSPAATVPAPRATPATVQPATIRPEAIAPEPSQPPPPPAPAPMPPAPAAASAPPVPSAPPAPKPETPPAPPAQSGGSPARPAWAPGIPVEPAPAPKAPPTPSLQVPAWAPHVPLASEPGTPTWFSPKENIPHATAQPIAQHAQPQPEPAPASPVVGGQLPVAQVPAAPAVAPAQAGAGKPAWEVVEQQRKSGPNATAPAAPTAEDRSYAEWFAWAKRGGAPASACHAAAQGAFKALSTGKDVATAVQWATAAMSRPPEPVSQARQQYCAWFALANIDLNLDQHRAHLFAAAAVQQLDAGQDAAAAHAAGLVAAGIR